MGIFEVIDESLHRLVREIQQALDKSVCVRVRVVIATTMANKHDTIFSCLCRLCQ